MPLNQVVVLKTCCVPLSSPHEVVTAGIPEEGHRQQADSMPPSRGEK